MLRLFVDKPGGVGIDDCQRVSRELGDVLDASALIEEAYDLEVSSPGLDRQLRKDRPGEMPGQRGDALQWPYVEGLRMDEAMHPLTILAVGLYGKTLMNQNGAPIRLVVPWKYGFKGIKSIVHIKFVEKQPPTSWNISDPREYGFYSNVNPEVDHPRWSQARERRLPSLFASYKTQMFNGYGDQVASMYAGMDLRKNY